MAAGSPARQRPAHAADSGLSGTEASPESSRLSGGEQRTLRKLMQSNERKVETLNGKIEDVRASMAAADPTDFTALGDFQARFPISNSRSMPLRKNGWKPPRSWGSRLRLPVLRYFHVRPAGSLASRGADDGVGVRDDAGSSGPRDQGSSCCAYFTQASPGALRRSSLPGSSTPRCRSSTRCRTGCRPPRTRSS